MKKLLILFSILFAFICCKNSVSAPKSEGSQIIGGGSVRKNTNLPTWASGAASIPKEYQGKYYYNSYDSYDEDYSYDADYTATVTDKDITLYYKDYDGNTREGGYFHVFDKNAEYFGDNSWEWNYDYDEDIYKYRDKYDFRLSIIFPDSIHFMSEEGRRIFYKYGGFGVKGVYIHEDDINK